MGSRTIENLNERRKTEEQTMDDDDQFSKLPEALIIEILSMLELKDAIKTGLLSKSWRNLWTQVYNIVLKFHPDYSHDELLATDWLGNMKLKYKRWVSSVDHTLSQCTATYINRFSVTDFRGLSVVTHKWIQYVLQKNVKILKLSSRYFSVAPDYLFQSSSIIEMELCEVMVHLTSPANLTSLKSLVLTDPVYLFDTSLEKLLMGCPMLENLVISTRSRSCAINHLNIIMSLSVKKLKLNKSRYDLLHIKVPCLQELEITGCFVTTQCQLVDVSSLTKATLTFHTDTPAVNESETEWEYNDSVTEYNYRWIPMVEKLLSSLSHVGELIIGSEPIQVLTLSKVLGTSSPLFKCKHLSIETYLWKYELPGIVCLLENAPHVETLFIKVLEEWWVSPLPEYELFEDRDPHLNMSNGKFMHLRNITIDYWRYPCGDDSYGEYFDFELVEYILRSSVVLEKLVLYSLSGRCKYSCPLPNCAFQYIPRLSSRLIATFLSGDEAAAEWELKKTKNKFVFTFSNYASLHPAAEPSS